MKKVRCIPDELDTGCTKIIIVGYIISFVVAVVFTARTDN